MFFPSSPLGSIFPALFCCAGQGCSSLQCGWLGSCLGAPAASASTSLAQIHPIFFCSSCFPCLFNLKILFLPFIIVTLNCLMVSLNHLFFFFPILNLDFYSCGMFPFTIICSNWECCQLSKYPSPDEASFTSLVTLPGFFTTTAASLLLFIMHVSSSSSCLNLGGFSRDYCRDIEVLWLQGSSSTR